jgi:hypothetical protein
MADSKPTTEVNAATAPEIARPQFGWRDIPMFAGIVGTLAVTLSVAREGGFFSVLDLKLLSLLSTNNMLVNSFVAIPVVASAVGFLMGLFGFLAWVPEYGVERRGAPGGIVDGAPAPAPSAALASG